MRHKILPIIFLTFIVQIYSFGDSILSRRVYNIPGESPLYRYGVDIIILGEEVFVVENRTHKIYKYRIKGDLEFVRTIGQKGRGPSDLFLPMELSFWNGKFAVKDEDGVSFFNRKGEFIDKFRLFSPRISFVYVNNKIFLASSNPSVPDLIGVYSENGKLLNKFGKKFLDLKSENPKKFRNPFFAERYFYRGKILSDGKSIYYLSSKFGRILKFNLDGNKVKDGDFIPATGNIGKRIVSENQKLLENGLKRNRDNSYSSYNLFHDAFLYNDEIYILIANIFVPDADNGAKKADETYISQIDTKTFKPITKYLLKLNSDERIHSFAVTEKKGKLIFVTSMYTEEGTDLVVFKE